MSRPTRRPARGTARTNQVQPGVMPLAPELIASVTPPAAARRAVTGVLLRFISCGLLGLASGVAWRLLVAPPRVGPATAFAGIFFLLLGFMVGGMLWYIADVRRRQRNSAAITDEKLVFSFIVFAAVPFAVLLFVGLVWLLVLVIGSR